MTPDGEKSGSFFNQSGHTIFGENFLLAGSSSKLLVVSNCGGVLHLSVSRRLNLKKFSAVEMHVFNWPKGLILPTLISVH